MQKTILAIVSAFGLLLPQMTQGQPTLYVSNLGQTPIGSAAIGSDSWIAQNIATGSNPAGYALNSIQLLMDNGSGTPSGFSVSLYSKTGVPHSFNLSTDTLQSSLGSLSGSNPSAGGLFTYSTPGITLAPSTFYFVVVTAATPVAQGAYTWSAANTFTQSNGFTIDDVYFSSANGTSWTSHVRQDVFQMGIYATAVPEPAMAGLMGLGLTVGWMSWRRRQRREDTNFTN